MVLYMYKLRQVLALRILQSKIYSYTIKTTLREGFTYWSNKTWLEQEKHLGENVSLCMLNVSWAGIWDCNHLTYQVMLATNLFEFSMVNKSPMVRSWGGNVEHLYGAQRWSECWKKWLWRWICRSKVRLSHCSLFYWMRKEPVTCLIIRGPH